jgi:hypothetical protein
MDDIFTVYKLSDFRDIPFQDFDRGFISVTCTGDEISIITNQPVRFRFLKSEGGWKGFRVAGILDFSLTGIIHDITKPLKENSIPVFVISTFDTDYIFIKESSFEKVADIFKTTKNIHLSY